MKEGFFGLLRIMLLDSFLPKRTYEVNLEGNTNVTGDNGLGETSLIKLPVIFYGANPKDVSIRGFGQSNLALLLDQNPEMRRTKAVCIADKH
jgi:ABC-type molybdenum transport system ATPase subunit/photorepair protein PhrA